MRWPFRQASALVVSAATLWAGAAVAQSPEPPSPQTQSDAPPPPPDGGRYGHGPEHRIEMLRRSLNLTPDQTTQVKALLEAERSKMEALRSNSALSPEDRRSQRMAIHQDTNSKMHGILSPDQATKYDSMEARMREHRRPEDGPPPPPPGPGER